MLAKNLLFSSVEFVQRKRLNFRQDTKELPALSAAFLRSQTGVQPPFEGRGRILSALMGRSSHPGRLRRTWRIERLCFLCF